MITAIDTSVPIDVFGADPHFGAASASALRLCLNEGAVVANEAVWSETRAAFGGDDEFLHAIQAAGIRFLPTSQKAPYLKHLRLHIRVGVRCGVLAWRHLALS